VVASGGKWWQVVASGGKWWQVVASGGKCHRILNHSKGSHFQKCLLWRNEALFSFSNCTRT